MDDKGKELNEVWGGEEPTTTERTCLICGCTDSKACEGGCTWVLPEICSKCLSVRIPDCLEAMARVLVKFHEAEMSVEHNQTDNARTCPACFIIKDAGKIAGAFRQ